ncbi:MAG: hypothetical protein ACJ74U_08170 [Jatrophihabitantaceae bacterium]
MTGLAAGHRRRQIGRSPSYDIEHCAATGAAGVIAFEWWVR